MGVKKQWMVMHGGSSNVASPYATTSAVAQRGMMHPPRPPATPWMGEHQSRDGYLGSGFSQSYYRDKPPGNGKLGTLTTAHFDYARPQTAPMQEYTGDKNHEPLTSCLQRGNDKEPRYYPIAIGAQHNAESLIAPPGGDSTQRFQPPSIFTPLKAARTLSGKNGQPPPKQSGFTAASVEAAKTLMTASQSDGIERTPALTLLGAERVAADSTRRYFHARDYKEQPFLSSKNYYDEDRVEQREVMEASKATKRTALSTWPETQFAAMSFSPHTKPFAEDTPPHIPAKEAGGNAVYGTGVGDSWGGVPSQDRFNLLPTGFASNHQLHTRTLTKEIHPEGPDGMQFLPARFLRQRMRNDYLQWGGKNTYETTAKFELAHPRVQVPIAGARDEMPWGETGVSVMYDGRRSGYEMNVIAESPITRLNQATEAARPMTSR